MEKSSTSTFQKIVIWFIIVAMTVGSLGAYFVVIISNENQKREAAQQAEIQKQLQKQQEEEAKKEKQPLNGYTSEKFDASAVKSLKVKIIKTGNGKTAGSKSTLTVNYFGWTSDGKIFDSTKKDGQIAPATFSLDQVIKGWSKGLEGVKAGSVVKLSIPTDQAYGENPQPGAPQGPLMFIVEVQEVK